VEKERFSIDEQAASKIADAQKRGGRVLAVGTTTTRALEAAARRGNGVVSAGSGVADLFIYPGFDFQVVTGLMTNFHLPMSSLLMLVSAFAGRERILAAYREAIASGYKFYSYGDAMVIL
jgi:S-adenosylmethionine:tRNA ribosyltransferase-isomerase